MPLLKSGRPLSDSTSCEVAEVVNPVTCCHQRPLRVHILPSEAFPACPRSPPGRGIRRGQGWLKACTSFTSWPVFPLDFPSLGSPLLPAFRAASGISDFQIHPSLHNGQSDSSPVSSTCCGPALPQPAPCPAPVQLMLKTSLGVFTPSSSQKYLTLIP